MNEVTISKTEGGLKMTHPYILSIDTFVTSDLGYHDFLDTQGLNLIDAGHFPTENVVCEELVRRLSEAFPTIQITKSAVHHDAVQFYMS